MKWAVWVRQDGEGCGYTVGCGEKLISLKATTEEEARKEAVDAIREHTHMECWFDEAKLVVLQDDLQDECDKVWRQYLSDRDDAIKQQKREQIARLKREIGEE